MPANISKVTIFHFAIAIAVASWTGVLLSLYWWAYRGECDHFDEAIKYKAESLAQNSQNVRSWIGGHGGVYVQVGEGISPIPLLAELPERDIETPSGRKLTLLNSPALLRQMFHEFEGSGGGDRIRLVADHPINPSNAPDDWEKKALTELEAGATKVQTFVHIGEERYFRLMYPMEASPKCGLCHHFLSTNEPKVVGGLSVIADQTPHDGFFNKALYELKAGYLAIWIIGLFGLAVFGVTGTRLLRNIEFTATHDALTQLKNRGGIDRLLKLECMRADRYGNPLSVMLLDIDHFKRINDLYGHQAGDEALCVVAQTIKQNIRETDIAGRYGGEEFLIVATDTARERAKNLAQRLNMAIRDAAIKPADGEPFFVTVSIGVSCDSPERKSAESLVKSADEALYQAKESGRDRVCFS